MNPSLRLGGSPLTVQVTELPPYLVGQWIGVAVEAARDTCQEAVGELLARPAERLILDFSRLAEVGEAPLQALVRLITESQRLGRNVWLVRCPEELFRRLQRGGVAGAVRHAGSLLAATDGLSGETAGALELHLRSTPELLGRLRRVISAVSREAGVPEAVEFQLNMAVTEAAANAIVHGSPEGPRNHVRIAFHVEGDRIIVDVADQGPGFDPATAAPPAPEHLREHGYGLHMMRQTMDRVEFFRDESGMLVRLTKYLGRSPGGWQPGA